MMWARRLWLKLQSLFRRERSAERLDDEIQFHLDQQIAENIAAGMSREEAFYAARRAFGNPTVLKEETRDTWAWTWLEQIVQDLRLGLRMLTKNPGFTVVTVLTLALGIGVNAAIFNTANAALWRTLPVADPQNLVRLIAVRQDHHQGESLPGGIFEELRRSAIFSDVITRTDDGLSFSYNGGSAERVVGEVVSPNFFTFLGVRPVLGEGFSAGVQKGQWAPEVVLSYRFWQRRFGRDPHILGQRIRLNNYPFTIVGVSPQNFYSLTVGFDPELRAPEMPPGQSLSQSELLSSDDVAIMARLTPGIGMSQAEAAADAACQQLLRDDPENQHRINPTLHIRVVPAGKGWQGDLAQYRMSLFVLIGLAGVVLLVTSFNLTSMLLARATTRRREFAVRSAIGAGRSRLVRQMFTESMLLALAAGGAGFALMSSTGKIILRFLPQGHINAVLDLSPDPRTLWFTVGLTLLAGVAIGLVPALHATGNNLTLAFKSDSAASIGDARGATFRKVLMVSQVALSLLLLTLAGLFERSLASLRASDSFPQPDRVLLFRMKPQKELYDGQRIRLLAKEVVRRTSPIPGVKFAALAEEGPYGSRGPMRATVRALDGRTADAEMDIVTPSFFATLGVPVLSGRDFSARDDERSKPVVIVDELLAQQLFRAVNPIGKMIDTPVQGNDVAFEIIGVVRSSRYYDLHQSPSPMIFFNLQQEGPYMPTLHVRVDSPARTTVVSEVRRELGVVDKDVPIFDVKTLEDRALDSLAQQRLVSDLAVAFGALALTLVAVGLYGLMAFSVARRTREIGVRIALGAARADVTRIVLRDVLWMVCAGLAIGAPLAFWGKRVAASLIPNLSVASPLPILVAAAIIIVVGLIAAYPPARRAMRVDPMVALRYE